MVIAPRNFDPRHFDEMDVEQIQDLLEYYKEEDALEISLAVSQSNKNLEERLKDKRLEISTIKEMNLVLLNKLWSGIDEKDKPNAASFFEDLTRKFE